MWETVSVMLAVEIFSPADVLLKLAWKSFLFSTVGIFSSSFETK